MNTFWIAPLLLGVLALLWVRIQRAWVDCMGQPADADALLRQGACGSACRCAQAPSRAGQDEEEGRI